MQKGNNIEKKSAPKTGSEPGIRGYFTPQTAAENFSTKFLKEDLCRAWILDRLHPEGPRCPECSSPIANATTLENWRAGKRVTCKGCGCGFTALSGTFLHGTNLSLTQVFLLAVLAYLMERGIDVNRIAEIIGVSSNTVRLWLKRFRVCSYV